MEIVHTNDPVLITYKDGVRALKLWIAHVANTMDEKEYTGIVEKLHSMFETAYKERQTLALAVLNMGEKLPYGITFTATMSTAHGADPPSKKRKTGE